MEITDSSTNEIYYKSNLTSVYILIFLVHVNSCIGYVFNIPAFYTYKIEDSWFLIKLFFIVLLFDVFFGLLVTVYKKYIKKGVAK